MIRYYFLREDLEVLGNRVNELHEEIKDLAKEQGEANSQSTENFGHDDACQEAIYQKRTIVLTQLKDLVLILNGAVIIEPEKQFEIVLFGSIVELNDGRRLRIGSYAIYAEHPIRTISYNSPLGKRLIGKRRGDEIIFQDQKLLIVTIC
jgi:transcription elongation GreA/GreB family factor